MDFFELKARYLGHRAKHYDQARVRHTKWVKESESLLLFLKEIESEALSILDLPCGTGRIIDLLANHSIRFGYYFGGDISDDMLDIAKNKIPQEIAHKTSVANANALSYAQNPEAQVPSVVFCLRFVNWLSRNDLKLLLKNLKNTGATHICITNRSIDRSGNILQRIFREIASRISYSTWKRQQMLHDINFFLEELGAEWRIEREEKLESRLDGTVLSLLIFHRQ